MNLILISNTAPVIYVRSPQNSPWNPDLQTHLAFAQVPPFRQGIRHPPLAGDVPPAPIWPWPGLRPSPKNTMEHHFFSYRKDERCHVTLAWWSISGYLEIQSSWEQRCRRRRGKYSVWHNGQDHRDDKLLNKITKIRNKWSKYGAVWIASWKFFCWKLKVERKFNWYWQLTCDFNYCNWTSPHPSNQIASLFPMQRIFDWN